MKLYIAGHTTKSEQAISNLSKICNENFQGLCEWGVIDVLENPQLAEEKKIIVTPTLIKEFPLPLRRVIGDLSNKEKVLIGLDIQRLIRSNHDRSS